MEKFNLPLLPLLNVVFFPKIISPITLTDPNYIRMIEHASFYHTPIAITYASPLFEFGRASTYYPHPIGTLAVAHIVSRTEFEAEILVQGVTRIELGKMVTREPYAIFEATNAPDDHTNGETFNAVSNLQHIFDSWCLSTIPNESDRNAFKLKVVTVYHLVDYISAYIIHDLPLKQILLECRSLIERIFIINALLDKKAPFAMNPLTALSIKDFENNAA